MKRKHPFDPFAGGDTPDSECLVQPAALTAYDDAGKNLNPLLVAFYHSRVHADAVPDVKVRYVGLQLFLFDCIDNAAHNDLLWLTRRAVTFSRLDGKIKGKKEIN